MGMESKLEKLINTLEKLSDVKNVSEDTPIVMRHTDVTTNRTIAIVCSQGEPINMVLPLNVVWICYRADSPLYKQALRRVSKSPGSFGSEGITQDWEVLYFYEDILEDQTYDPSDLSLVGVSPVPYASVEGPGKARISVDPADPSQPVFIVSDDPRMSDNRVPTAHTHVEKPATMLAHSAGHGNILNSVAQVNAALMFTPSGDLEWRKITPDDIA